MLEGRVVEIADVVEEVPGKGGVRTDGGGVEAEVGVVFDDLLIDRGMMDGDGNNGQLGAHGGLGGEEAAIEIFKSRGRDDIVIGRDELDAGVIEGKRAVAIVGDDNANRDEAMLDVGEAEEGAIGGADARLGGERDLFVGVGVGGSVLRCGFRGRGFFISAAGVVGREGREQEESEGCGEERPGSGFAHAMRETSAGRSGEAAGRIDYDRPGWPR